MKSFHALALLVFSSALSLPAFAASYEAVCQELLLGDSSVEPMFREALAGELLKGRPRADDLEEMVELAEKLLRERPADLLTSYRVGDYEIPNKLVLVPTQSVGLLAMIYLNKQARTDVERGVERMYDRLVRHARELGGKELPFQYGDEFVAALRKQKRTLTYPDRGDEL